MLSISNPVRHYLMVSALAVVACLPILAWGGDLTVLIHNVKSDEGAVLVGLYDSPESFLKTIKAGQRALSSSRDAKGDVRVVFVGLPPGHYALSAFQDINNNGKLDMNPMGVPMEPYGFAPPDKSAPASMGPPSFADTAFDVGTNALTISVELH